MSDPQRPTRDQLQRIAGNDFRLLRALELLFESVAITTPVNVDELTANVVAAQSVISSLQAEWADILENLNDQTPSDISGRIIELWEQLDKSWFHTLPVMPRMMALLEDVDEFTKSEFWVLRYNATTDKWTAINDHSVGSTAVDTALDTTAYTMRVTVTAKTITLPAANAILIGRRWTIILEVDGYVVIAPNGSDIIILPTSDTTVTMYGKGNSLTFECLSATIWGMV